MVGENVRITASAIGFSKGLVMQVPASITFDEILNEANNALAVYKAATSEYDPILLYDYLCTVYGEQQETIALSTDDRFKRSRYSVCVEYPRENVLPSNHYILLISKHGDGSLVLIKLNTFSDPEEAIVVTNEKTKSGFLEDVLSTSSDGKYVEIA